MRYLLDTNTCIRYLNGRSESIRRHIESKSPEDILICSIVKAELFYGSQKSRYPEKNLEKQQRFVNCFQSLSQKLNEILKAIDDLRHDTEQINALPLKKITWLQKADIRQEEYLQNITHLIEKQQQEEKDPTIIEWDLKKTPWENIVEYGAKYIGEFTFPQ